MHSPASSSQPTVGNLTELRFTPFMDLTLVLLLIFVLTAPFLLSQPKTTEETTAPLIAEPSRVFVLSLDEQGRASFAGSRLDEAGIQAKVQGFLEKDPNIGIVIRTHERLPAEDLVQVMDLVKATGVRHLGVTTQ